MATIASINVFTDKKAKILTAIKAAFRNMKTTISPDAAKKAKELISDAHFSELIDAYGENISEECAIVLYDDYVSVYFEDIPLEELEALSLSYSQSFGKPVIYTAITDDEVMTVGVMNEGVFRTKLIFGECAADYDLEKSDINMDYLMFIYNSRNLQDLNKCGSIGDISFCLEEDYGIYAELSPLSIPIFDDKYKLLEKSDSFSVYSAI